MRGEFVKVNVRLATVHDASVIASIAQDWIPFNPEACVQRLRTFEETFEDCGHVFFVAELEGKMVGYIEVRTYKDWFVLRRSIHIEHAIVLKDYRWKGIGTQILKAIFEYFKDPEDMYVLFFYTESSWNGFWETHNKMQNSGQTIFIKLIEKKKRQ